MWTIFSPDTTSTKILLSHLSEIKRMLTDMSRTSAGSTDLPSQELEKGRNASEELDSWEKTEKGTQVEATSLQLQ